MENKVLISGPVFVDMIYSGLPGTPETGKELFCDEFMVTAGGFAITAIGLARLKQRTELISVIGDDFLGDYLRDFLFGEGIDIQHLIRIDNGSTSNTTAFVHDEDRGFLTKMGSEIDHEQRQQIIFSRLETGEISHLHLGLEYTQNLQAYLEKTRAMGIRNSLVTGWGGVKQYSKQPKKLENILQQTDFFFCNRSEACQLTGVKKIEEAALSLKKMGTRPVITLGAKGAMLVNDWKQMLQVEAYPVDAVDPTGAGDSFAAGFITGLQQNYPLKKCLRLGVVCGSRSTEKVGGTTAFPHLDQIDTDFIEEGIL